MEADLRARLEALARHYDHAAEDVDISPSFSRAMELAAKWLREELDA